MLIKSKRNCDEHQDTQCIKGSMISWKEKNHLLQSMRSLLGFDLVSLKVK